MDTLLKAYFVSIKKRYEYSAVYTNEFGDVYDPGEDNEGDFYSFDVSLDLIKKVDNVNVQVKIRFEHDGDMLFTIRHFETRFKVYEMILRNGPDIGNDLGRMFVIFMDMYRKIAELIDNLKFNTITHQFADYDVNKDMLCILGHDIDDCSVCYEPTNYKTNCNHYTCHKCVQKLNNPKKCPLCRSSIIIDLDRRRNMLFL